MARNNDRCQALNHSSFPHTNQCTAWAKHSMPAKTSRDLEEPDTTVRVCGNHKRVLDAGGDLQLTNFHIVFGVITDRQKHKQAVQQAEWAVQGASSAWSREQEILEDILASHVDQIVDVFQKAEWLSAEEQAAFDEVRAQLAVIEEKNEAVRKVAKVLDKVKEAQA